MRVREYVRRPAQCYVPVLTTYYSQVGVIERGVGAGVLRATHDRVDDVFSELWTSARGKRELLAVGLTLSCVPTLEHYSLLRLLPRPFYGDQPPRLFNRYHDERLVQGILPLRLGTGFYPSCAHLCYQLCRCHIYR